MAFEPPRSEMPLVARLVLALIGGLLSAVIAAGVFLLFGAIIGPAEPVDWSTQPLEVVVDGFEGGECVLNVDSVAPGEHGVAVIANESPSLVTISDPSNRVVFRAHATPKPGGPYRTVRLELGTYQVRCRSHAGTDASVNLPVRPASELE